MPRISPTRMVRRAREYATSEKVYREPLMLERASSPGSRKNRFTT